MTTYSRRTLLGGMAVLPVAAPVILGTRGIFDVAVVGAGVFGAFSALRLAEAGKRVALIEAYGPGNARASSGGESRVIRTAYGKDRIYSEWARDSLPDWQALSARESLPLFHATGVLWLSSGQDAYTRQSMETLADLGVAHEILERADIARRWPQIATEGVTVGLYEPGSGGLMARRAVMAAVRAAEALGVRLIHQKAGAPKANGDGVEIPLDDGGKLYAARAVYACGPWLPKIFPDHLGGRIVPTRQEVFYFGASAGERRFAPPLMPVWADFNDGDITYGLPDLEGRGFKIAFDRHGPVIDPDSMDRRPSESALAAVRKYIARRFPALSDAPLLEARVCQYENSANGDFLIDWHPDLAAVLLVGAGSGHGFKHGPRLGRHVAGLIGGDERPIARFSLASKARGGERMVH
ncbi:MAG: N-methyl-L-tryptophan oxidase [Rhodothalassiaceae bacterium]